MQTTCLRNSMDYIKFEFILIWSYYGKLIPCVKNDHIKQLYAQTENIAMA